MERRTRRWIVAGGAALALGVLTLPEVSTFSITSASGWSGLEAGAACDADAKPAPLAYTLKDMNGADVTLSDYKGKVILINFWATWCGPCKVEIPGFVELQQKYGSQGLVILGLSVDDPPEKIKPFAADYKINYPLLVGLGRDDFQEEFAPVWGIPASFIVARDGTLCHRLVGYAAKEDFENAIRALL
jgi:cytochrome c biogenesis protein CcmG/thiol:disulfide interchange protein DsbE